MRKDGLCAIHREHQNGKNRRKAMPGAGENAGRCWHDACEMRGPGGQRAMIPAAFPTLAPALSAGEFFGPLAPIAVLGVALGMAILVTLLLVDARSATRRRGRITPRSSASPGPSRYRRRDRRREPAELA